VLDVYGATRINDGRAELFLEHSTHTHTHVHTSYRNSVGAYICLSTTIQCFAFYLDQNNRNKQRRKANTVEVLDVIC